MSTNEVFDGSLSRRARRTGRTRRRARSIHTASRSSPPSVAARRRIRRLPASSASFGRPGCSGRRTPTFPAGSSPPPDVLRRCRLSPCASWATSGGRPPTPTTWPRGSWTCWPRMPSAGIHHIVNGGVASRAEWARDAFRRAGIAVEIEPITVDAWPRASTAPAPRDPRPDAAPVRRPTPNVARRDGRLRADPSGRVAAIGMSGPSHDPVRAAGCSLRRRRPARRRRAAHSGKSGERTPSAPSTQPRPGWPPGARTVVRPGQPVRLRAWRPARPALPSTSTRLLDRQRRSCPGRPGGPPADAARTGRARPVVETRELRADDWVTIPSGVAHGFLAMEPLQLLYLVTNAYDGSDELGFAWDDPDAAVPWPAFSTEPRRPTDPVGSGPHQSIAGGPRGAPAPRPLTRKAYDRSGPCSD